MSIDEGSRRLPVVTDGEAGGAPVFERIAVVGLGLIGGSVALAARRAWPTALVIGVDRRLVLEKAIGRHAIDVASEDLMIVSEADLVVLAAPVGQNLDVLAALPATVPGEATVTDVGSTKRAIVDASRVLPPRLRFVGGHPLAGAALGGIDHARADLFVGRPWLFAGGGDGEAGNRLSAFVTALGARPVVVPSAGEHDRLVAFLSHLPQLAASALMAVVGSHVGEAGLALAGRGLVDSTRLASSPPDVWRDVCRQNADEIGPALDDLIQTLRTLREGLADGAAVDRAFGEANAWRSALSGSGTA
jgi:prephenate dehydrogenase